MIKTPTTRLIKSCDLIEKHLDIIYKMEDEFKDVEEVHINKLLEELESWRDCIVEVELKLKSRTCENDDGYEYDEENKELIIY
ncbi:MAG: hypothetical protein P8N93_01820 [Flavobacteriaceae bacterium]|jgi:hypothetical protein|nr:hypothetical protein [Flavobacteriaceae bacterium]